MRILGIDPGSRVTGWGIVSGVPGKKLCHIAHGCVRTQSADPLSERLETIFKTLTQVIGAHELDSAAIESIFVSRNVQSALKLGHARGVAMVAASSFGLSVHEYAAVKVKKSVVGYGQADKKQMQEMITRLLQLDSTPPSDAADALAVAVCHIHQTGFQTKAGHPLLAGLPARRGRGRRNSWRSVRL